MKIVSANNNSYVLRFDKGEEVAQGIMDFCATHSIAAAWVQLLGATDHVVLSYYNLQTKKYEDHELREDLEVTSVAGNLGMLDGKPILHIHGTFASRDLSVKGGHIKSLVVSATVEVHVRPLSGEIQRAYDPATGLNLMK